MEELIKVLPLNNVQIEYQKYYIKEFNLNNNMKPTIE